MICNLGIIHIERQIGGGGGREGGVLEISDKDNLNCSFFLKKQHDIYLTKGEQVYF